MLLTIVIAVALFFLTLASIYDLKNGEIPDKATIGFILSVMVLAIAMFLYQGDVNLLINPITIGIGYFTIAYILYYLGQWGGGDVKILLGLGGALGLLNSLGYQWNAPMLPYYIVYFIDMGVIVLPYALIYMLILSALKPVVFKKFRENILKTKTIMLLIIAAAFPLIIYFITKFNFFILFTIILPVFVLASIFLKTSEESLLTKTILVSELREADALAEDLVYDGRKIALRREIEGVSKQQLDLIKKLALENKIHSKIKIRWGVKFAPILMLSFLLTVYCGDLLALLIKAIAKSI
jgi:Flp pilus assembly protein protease CpaA